MAQWKAGADTCVFKPAVRCAGESNRRPGVSRVRTKEAGARDLAVEERIRTAFPDLVSSGAVVVYSKACSPVYDAQDMKSEVEGAEACAALGVRKGPADHLNLITPKMDGTMAEYFEAHPEANRREVLQPAALTAVAMVPDAGPWIVHMDLHLGNVLYKGKTIALADWGRTLIIENPADLESVRKGIREWMAGYGGPVDETADVLVANLAMLDWPVAKHMGALLTDPVEGMEEHLAAIRGWAVYVLLGSSDPTLLTATSQAELRSRLTVRGGFSMKSRAMRKTRRGGAQWREGVDTCVFKPAVRCEGEADRREGVSRIRDKSVGERDTLIETKLREAFPMLVNALSVSVYSHVCTPEYDDEDADDELPWEKNGGCEKLGEIEPGPNPEHQNFITTKFQGTLKSYLMPGGVENIDRIREWKSVLRYATRAAVELVPDNGPWIIHADCHFGNVLWRVRANGEVATALGDWGRAILIENPKDIVSVQKGIREWVGSLEYLETPADSTTNKIAAAISRVGNRTQHPRRILNPLVRLILDRPISREADLAALRGWVLYVIINQMMNYLPEGDPVVEPDEIEALLAAPNQAQLKAYRLSVLDRHPLPPRAAPVAVVGEGPREGGAYWPAKYFKGLTRRQNAQRKRSATRRTKMSSKDPKAYVPFKSDKGQKTRKSSYTERFHKKYPGVTSLPDIAKATGVPKATLQKVYDRGMAAWRTGHRPGASQQAWGMARVYSFVLHGKTYHTADKDLATTG